LSRAFSDGVDCAENAEEAGHYINQATTTDASTTMGSNMATTSCLKFSTAALGCNTLKSESPQSLESDADDLNSDACSEESLVSLQSNAVDSSSDMAKDNSSPGTNMRFTVRNTLLPPGMRNNYEEKRFEVLKENKDGNIETISFSYASGMTIEEAMSEALDLIGSFHCTEDIQSAKRRRYGI